MTRKPGTLADEHPQMAALIKHIVRFSEQRDELYLVCHQARHDKQDLDNQQLVRQDTFDPTVFNSFFMAQIAADERVSMTRRRLFYAEEGLHTALRELRAYLASTTTDAKGVQA